MNTPDLTSMVHGMSGNMYRIAGFDCKQKFLRISYLGHRRNARGFYIYKYVECIELFLHVFVCVWCDRRLLLHPLQCLFRLQLVRGNHIYKAIWDNHASCEELSCMHVDVKGTIFAILLQFLHVLIIIGHVPGAISIGCLLCTLQSIATDYVTRQN